MNVCIFHVVAGATGDEQQPLVGDERGRRGGHRRERLIPLTFQNVQGARALAAGFGRRYDEGREATTG
jgi:hypothetical protein